MTLFVLYHATDEGVYLMSASEDAETLRKEAADLEGEFNDDLQPEPAALEWEMEDRAAPGSGSRVDVEVCQPPWFTRDNYYAIQQVR